jgi:hypothetical protein
MRFLKEASIVLFCVFVFFCFIGTAAAADVITKTGNNYTIVLDPSMTDNGTNVMDLNGTVYSDMTLSAIYIYSGSYTSNFTLFVDPNSITSIIFLNIDVSSTENVTINFTGGYNNSSSTAFDIMKLTLSSSPNRITINGNNYSIDDKDIVIFAGTASPNTFEIRNLNISGGNLRIQDISFASANKMTVSNSKITNGMLSCLNISSAFLSIENVTVSNNTSGSNLIILENTPTSLTITNTKIENGNLDLSAPLGTLFGLKNISISNLTLTNGNLNISTANDTINKISVINSNISGSFGLTDVNAGSTAFVTVTNLTLTGGQISFSDMIVRSINVTNSKVANGQLNISSNVSAENFLIFNSNFSNTAPGPALIILNGPGDLNDSNFSDTAPGPALIILSGSGDMNISNNKLKNGSLALMHFGTSLRIINNTISNTSHVLVFDSGFGGFDYKYIYNNKFVVDSGNAYISDLSGFALDLNRTPASGSGLTGGPYVAGNYWTTSTGNGYSDMLAGNEKGYSAIPFNIPVTGNGTFIDNYPLTKYIQPQGNSKPPNLNSSENDAPENNGNDSNTSTNNGNDSNTSTNNGNETTTGGLNDSNQTNKTSSNEKKSLGGTFKTLKEENVTTEEVIIDYIAPASVVMGAVASALLLLIISLIDLFFDLTSEQIRELSKERTKYKFKFNPPKLSDIFKAKTAYMIFLFIIGVCVIDMILDEMTYAAIDAGLLTFLVVIVPPFVIRAIVNIGGGLLLDEVVSYYLKKTGKMIRRNTSILDIIEQKRSINVIVFFAVMFVGVGIVTFFVLFFGWTLI